MKFIHYVRKHLEELDIDEDIIDACIQDIQDQYIFNTAIVNWSEDTRNISDDMLEEEWEGIRSFLITTIELDISI